MLTKEQIVLLADMAYVRGVQSDHAAAIRAAIDLAGRCLDAPERDLTWKERARWGECKTCGCGHGTPCEWTGTPAHVTEDGFTHPARFDAAPTRVRLVPVVP